MLQSLTSHQKRAVSSGWHRYDVADKMPSYTVRCLFEWPRRDEIKLAHLYEERITIWSAETIDLAIERAEVEATAYALENGLTFLEYSQGFWMFTEVEVDGIEVFSLLRESNFDRNSYLDTFHDTGYEIST